MSAPEKEFTGRLKQVDVEKRKKILKIIEKICNVSIENVYCRGSSIIDILDESTCLQCLYNNNCQETDCKEYSTYKILSALETLEKI